MGRRNGFTVVLAALALLTSNIASAQLAQERAGAGLEQSPASSIWKIAKTPNLGGFSNDLFAISADTANDIWAVGLLSLHFDGTKWTAIPVVQADEWDGIAALSPTDVWAVGQISQNGLNFSEIQHWDGAKWSLVNSPHFPEGEILMGVQAVSPQDIFAAGWFVDVPNQTLNPLVEHWDGNSWSVVNTPRFSSGSGAILYSIAIVSDSDIWTVGETGTLDGYNDQPFAMHFDGKQWKRASMPVVGQGLSQFWHVTAISTDDVWAVGLKHANPINAPARTLVEHWDGTKWKVAPSPNVNPKRDNELLGVDAISSSDVWACGLFVNNQGNHRTLVEHWDGQKWTVSNSPNRGIADNLFGVAALPPGNVWLAGAATVGPADKTLILETTQGR